MDQSSRSTSKDGGGAGPGLDHRDEPLQQAERVGVGVDGPLAGGDGLAGALKDMLAKQRALGELLGGVAVALVLQQLLGQGAAHFVAIVGIDRAGEQLAAL